jgi:hypothetical protein
MEPVLSQRYLTLFRRYRVRDRADLALIKTELLTRINQEFLRPDAALLLLSLYDRMILLPYTGDIRIRPLRSPTLPLPAVARDRTHFSGNVQRSLTEIFAALERVPERPISSHQVLRALLEIWPTISELYGWA